MSQHHSHEFVVPLAPPLSQPLQPPARPSTWPTVIGIVAVILGSLGMLAGLWGALSPLLLGWIGRAFTPENEPDPLAFMEDWKLWISLSSVVTLSVAALLLLGGIALLKRARSARGKLIAWAVTKMVLVVVVSTMNYFMQQDQFRAMAEQDPMMGGMLGLQNFMVAIGVFGLVIAVLWGWALPVFMLIWFTRPKIVNEVERWRAGRA